MDQRVKSLLPLNHGHPVVRPSPIISGTWDLSGLAPLSQWWYTNSHPYLYSSWALLTLLLLMPQQSPSVVWKSGWVIHGRTGVEPFSSVNISQLGQKTVAAADEVFLLLPLRGAGMWASCLGYTPTLASCSSRQHSTFPLPPPPTLFKQQRGGDGGKHGWHCFHHKGDGAETTWYPLPKVPPDFQDQVSGVQHHMYRHFSRVITYTLKQWRNVTYRESRIVKPLWSN